MAEITPTPNVNPTGKQQLMSSGMKISDHRAIVSHKQFQDSLNLALLQYTQVLTRSSDPTNAGANMMKLRGAQEFIHEFVYLTEAPKLPAPMIKSAELDQRA